MIYIGIDPGLSGAMAVINGKTITVVPFSVCGYVDELDRLATWYDPSREVKAVVERVHSMPRQGVASSFKFGESYGMVLGMLAANRVSYELVLPNKWKREFGVTADKNTSIAVAQRLFPDVSFLRTEKCRKPDDGIAEALLMAEYCRRHS